VAMADQPSASWTSFPPWFPGSKPSPTYESQKFIEVDRLSVSLRGHSRAFSLPGQQCPRGFVGVDDFVPARLLVTLVRSRLW
jgi:hypothetical protein